VRQPGRPAGAPASRPRGGPPGDVRRRPRGRRAGEAPARQAHHARSGPTGRHGTCTRRSRPGRRRRSPARPAPVRPPAEPQRRPLKGQRQPVRPAVLAGVQHRQQKFGPQARVGCEGVESRRPPLSRRPSAWAPNEPRTSPPTAQRAAGATAHR
jgi:hypothetical protein